MIIVMIQYILKTFLDELILEYIQIYSILDIERYRKSMRQIYS
nr:MAG TPA: hypothetical protein [Caudoviricetes sp.]